MQDLPIVLVVEDEMLIQQVVEDALGEGGFNVMVALSGDEAVKLLDENNHYRAIITDVNLGRGQLSGWDVARHAREKVAELPIIYMTGDSAAEWASQGVPNSVLLVKPFAPVQIVTAIAQLLNTSPPIK